MYKYRFPSIWNKPKYYIRCLNSVMKQGTNDKRLFGQMIRKARREKSMGLREFAKKVGISATYLSRIENSLDYPPSGQRLSDMARVLGIDSDLLFETANKTITAFEKEKGGNTKYDKERIPPEFYEVYREKAKLLPEFFRIVKKKKLTDKEWKTLIEDLKKKKES